MKPTPLRSALLLTLLCALPCGAAPATPPRDERVIENLAAFVRVYGYVRFFHPSDAAAAADWERLAIAGAEAAADAATPDALRDALLSVFGPVAPTMLISPGPTAAAAPDTTDASRVTFWQYVGVNLSAQPGPYRQRRVISVDPPEERTPLFEPVTPPPAPFTASLPRGLTLHLPLALPVDRDNATGGAPAADLEALKARLAAFAPGTLTSADWRLRIAEIATVWNVFQHFHPYLDGIGVNWEETLRPALRRTLRDETGADYYATLSELVAHTHDGHGYVYGRRSEPGGVPIRVAGVEDRLVVTAAIDDVPLRKGDLITALDGTPALEVVRERERYAAGSPHLKRFRALNQFGAGQVGEIARFTIERDGAEVAVEIPRTPDRRGYFFNSIGEFTFPAFAELRPGIFYVNLYELDAPGLEEKLPQLAEARGVIFDWRLGDRTGREPDRNWKSIAPHQHIIPHLIDSPVQASPMLVPRLTRPDRAGWTWRESTWPVQPKAPRFKGPVVFINEPSVVSYGETCMAIIAHHRLATLVGAPTAGCNGNANFIPLSGGFRVMWTGMDVRKHDRSPFYTIGFVPDYPVARTLRGVREGRDEYLEQAIDVIERAAGPDRRG